MQCNEDKQFPVIIPSPQGDYKTIFFTTFKMAAFSFLLASMGKTVLNK